MPWCPKCETEYREGILLCPDCGTVLTGEPAVDMVCITTLPEETAQGLLAYYEYLGVDYSILEFDEACGEYQVLVPRSREDDIRKPTADYFRSLERNSDTPHAAAASEPLPITHRRKSEQLEDTRSSAWSFLGVGGVGILAVLLILAGILPFPFYGSGRILTLGVMGVLFLLFFGIGLSSFRKMGRLKTEADEEEQQTGDITDWFLKTYTREDIEAACDPTDRDELNYYQRTAWIKEQILAQHPVEEGLLDTIADTLYANYYD